jgi:uncharacterized protein (TIGR03083 family)
MGARLAPVGGRGEDGAMTETTTAYAGLAPDDYLRHLRADTDRILDVAGDDLVAEVPLCPGWNVRDAVEHTGAVFSHKVAALVANARPTEAAQWSHGPAADEDPMQWFRDRRDELLATLESRGPDAPSWTWHEDYQNAGFWYRRMAQEAAVHRVDVESGYDAVTPVDDALAVDGIDEVLDWFLSYQAEDVGPNAPGRGTVAVRTGGRIWRLRLTPDAVEVAREPGPADAVVSGEPSELYLWLWGRRPDTAVGLEGDDELLAGLRARLHVVTQ